MMKKAVNHEIKKPEAIPGGSRLNGFVFPNPKHSEIFTSESSLFVNLDHFVANSAFLNFCDLKILYSHLQ
jgi:hypothetical protein